MNKHQIIRSVSVLLFIALVFTFSNLDIGLIHSKQAANISNTEFNWHPDMTSELELQQFQFESEFAIHPEMANEFVEMEHLSVSFEDVECLIISSGENNECLSNSRLLFLTIGAND